MRDLCLVETALWNDYYLKQKGKRSIESKDLSTACESFNSGNEINDSGYPYDGRADKNSYPHDRRADKDSYLHDSNNQCIIIRLQLSFVMINVQLMLV